MLREAASWLLAALVARECMAPATRRLRAAAHALELERPGRVALPRRRAGRDPPARPRGPHTGTPPFRRRHSRSRDRTRRVCHPPALAQHPPPLPPAGLEDVRIRRPPRVA